MRKRSRKNPSTKRGVGWARKPGSRGVAQKLSAYAREKKIPAVDVRPASSPSSRYLLYLPDGREYASLGLTLTEGKKEIDRLSHLYGPGSDARFGYHSVRTNSRGRRRNPAPAHFTADQRAAYDRASLSMFTYSGVSPDPVMVYIQTGKLSPHTSDRKLLRTAATSALAHRDPEIREAGRVLMQALSRTHGRRAAQGLPRIQRYHKNPNMTISDAVRRFKKFKYAANREAAINGTDGAKYRRLFRAAITVGEEAINLIFRDPNRYLYKDTETEVQDGLRELRASRTYRSSPSGKADSARHAEGYRMMSRPNPRHRKNPQRSFNPVDYHFRWTPDGWYEWDREAATKAALKARNDAAKQLAAQGIKAKKSSLPNQLITRGGIGSGHPQIEHVVTIYMLDYTDPQEQAEYARRAAIRKQRGYY